MLPLREHIIFLSNNIRWVLIQPMRSIMQWYLFVCVLLTAWETKYNKNKNYMNQEMKQVTSLRTLAQTQEYDDKTNS